MKDKKPKQQLASELVEMRRRAVEPEALGTKPRQAQKALRDSQAGLSATFEGAPMTMILMDQERRVRNVNRAAVESIGRPAEEMIELRGGEALRCLHSLDDPKGCGFGPFCETCTLRRTVLDTFETGHSHRQVEAKLPLARGERQEERDLLVSTILLDVSGSPMVLVCIDDITERKRAEEALRERTDALGERVKELNCLYGISRLVEKPGISLEEIFQGTADLVPLAWKYAEVACARIILESQEFRTENFRETTWKQSADIVVHGEPSGAVEVRYLEERPESDEGPFHTEERDLITVIAERLGRVTERKRAEEALRRYTAELEARNEELDAFAHTVAHDLKNPLGLIVGFASVLEGDCATMPRERLQGYLHAIAQNGRKVNNIIDELLLLAGVRKQEVKMAPLDMAGIVAEAQQRLADMIEEYQVEIILPEAWPMALGHGPWVEEVWVNYLSNAIRYGGQPPCVELGATTLREGRVRFWIRDNGPGLAPKEQGRLFTPFTQLDQAHAKGHGLGLSIVRRIVEKLDGQVEVESEVGRGSIFAFTLPGVASDGHL